MNRRILVVAILIGFSSVRMSCINSNSPSTTHDTTTTSTHQTKIIGALSGQYASQETVTFFIDGGSIGDATGTGTVTELVTPDVDHELSATSKNVPYTFTKTINVQQGGSTQFNFPCNPAHVTIVTDAGLAVAGVTAVKIYDMSGPGPALIATLVPGEQGLVQVEPLASAITFAAFDQKGSQLSVISQKLTWDCTFTWTVSK